MLSCRECPQAPDAVIRWPLAVAVAAGAPALVLVSVAPVAALAGPPAVLIWPASAVIGLLMAVVFAELAGMFPRQSGGVGVLAAQALKPRWPFLGLLGQWSYWFGWSPLMPISAAVIAGWLQDALFPGGSPWFGWTLATALLAAVAFVNHFGIRACAKAQLALVVGMTASLSLVLADSLLTEGIDLRRLVPFAPPHGWHSSSGISALLGAFFLAGWSAYAAEVTLTYGPEHRGGVRSAVRSLLVTGAVMVAVYAAVPFVLFAALGVDRAGSDPSDTLALLSTGAESLVTAALTGVVVALLLSMNMAAVGDSRALYQMAQNGEAWAFLGRLNRHGAPGNALFFDAAFGFTLLLIALVASGGDIAAVPVTLLAAANVGYLLSLILALVGTWVMRRDHRDAPRPFQAPRGFVGLGLALAAFNAVLLAGAGTAWGWGSVGLGAVVIGAVPLIFCPLARRLALARAKAAVGGRVARAVAPELRPGGDV